MTDVDWSFETPADLKDDEIASLVRQAARQAALGRESVVYAKVDGFDVKIAVELDY